MVFISQLKGSSLTKDRTLFVYQFVKTKTDDLEGVAVKGENVECKKAVKKDENEDIAGEDNEEQNQDNEEQNEDIICGKDEEKDIMVKE